MPNLLKMVSIKHHFERALCNKLAPTKAVNANHHSLTKIGLEEMPKAKDSKMKVQGSIQGDAVRISGAKKDDLQAAMALLKKEITDIPLSFNNFRD